MTNGSVTKQVLPSRSESPVDGALIADKKVIKDSEDEWPIKNIVDDHRRKVVDEDLRLALKKIFEGIASIPDNWNDLTVRAQRDWMYMQVKTNYPNIPDNLLSLTIGFAIHGDCNRPSDAVPEWLDREKFKRGQRFAMDHYAGISLCEMLSLFMLFSFDNSLKPLIISGKSSEPFTSFKRYLSTGRRMRNWFSSDVWTAGTDGYRDIQIVRRMHENMRKKLATMDFVEIDKAAKIENSWSTCKETVREDFRSSCPADVPGQCPYMFNDNDKFRIPRTLNQGEMAGTQFGFMGLIILYPEKFGITDANDEDLDAYCHMWRGLGYLLGIDDEFNFCNGTIEEVKLRSRNLIKYCVKPNLRDISPEWEHMMRCVMEGITYYFPTVSYEHTLLYLADMIDIPMPRLRASITWYTWIRFHTLKFIFGVGARIPGVVAGMNRLLNACMDRGLAFTEEQLAALRKRSDITLSKGIAETVAVEKDMEMTKLNVWQMPFVVVSSAFLLLNLPIIVKEYASKLLHGDARSTLSS